MQFVRRPVLFGACGVHERESYFAKRRSEGALLGWVCSEVVGPVYALSRTDVEQEKAEIPLTCLCLPRRVPIGAEPLLFDLATSRLGVNNAPYAKAQRRKETEDRKWDQSVILAIE